MLLRFEASNHRSIMDAVELSMIAVDQDRPAVKSFDSLQESVLTVAGIYGANASGKSNVLEAIAWLSSAVSRSLRAWDDRVPRDPFKFNPGPHRPSRFEIEMVVSGVRYWYIIEVSDLSVEFEALYSYPERRRRTLFEREGMEISSRRGMGIISGTRELLTPTTLALSAAMRFGESEVRTFGQEIGRIASISPRRRLRGWGHVNGGALFSNPFNSTAQIFRTDATEQMSLLDDMEPEENKRRESALALLRFADLGIDDVTISEDSDRTAAAAVSQAQGDQPQRRLQLLHRTTNEQLAFDMTDESDGTQTWFRLIGPTLRALQRGQILLMDEIDASLHPRLSARLLQLFQDPETNPRGAQLIFTTHDTSLLNHLNRDEVWLTEKDESGATSLTALAEYGGERVRRSLNLEKSYLQGRFGAVPEFDQNIAKRAINIIISDLD